MRLVCFHCWLNHTDNYCAAVTVAMTDDQRSVTEGGTVMLTGQLGISVVVDLTSTVGTGKLIIGLNN